MSDFATLGLWCRFGVVVEPFKVCFGGVVEPFKVRFGGSVGTPKNGQKAWRFMGVRQP